MTKREREQAIELLRITVDCSGDVYRLGIDQGYSHRVIDIACTARWAVTEEILGPGLPYTNVETGNLHRLEAAARLEEEE